MVACPRCRSDRGRAFEDALAGFSAITTCACLTPWSQSVCRKSCRGSGSGEKLQVLVRERSSSEYRSRGRVFCGPVLPTPPRNEFPVRNNLPESARISQSAQIRSLAFPSHSRYNARHVSSAQEAAMTTRYLRFRPSPHSSSARPPRRPAGGRRCWCRCGRRRRRIEPKTIPTGKFALPRWPGYTFYCAARAGTGLLIRPGRSRSRFVVLERAIVIFASQRPTYAAEAG